MSVINNYYPPQQVESNHSDVSQLLQVWSLHPGSSKFVGHLVNKYNAFWQNIYKS